MTRMTAGERYERMRSRMAACLTCKRQAGMRVRGNCGRCYSKHQHAVREKKATWADLEAAGLAAPPKAAGRVVVRPPDLSSAGLDEVIGRLRACDGVRRKAATLPWQAVQALLGEIDRLRAAEGAKGGEG